MADVPVKIFRSRKTLVGVSPSIPSGVEGEPLPPVNPPGSNPSGGGGNDSNAVHYNASDGKDEIEKQQARNNIGSTSATPQVILTAGAINDLVVTSNHLVFTGADVVLSGIVAGLNGEEITILNVSGTNLTLLLQSALSAVDNRFNASVVVPNLSILRIKYRTTTNRWFFENVGVNDGRYVRKDIEDTKTGNLTINGSLIQNGRLIASTSAFAGHEFIAMTDQLALAIKRYTNTTLAGVYLYSRMFALANIEMYDIEGTGRQIRFFVTQATGRVIHSRSGAANESIRRDEQRLFYLSTITTVGVITNQALTAGIFNYQFTAATSITGFTLGEIGLSIIIQNQTGATLTLVHESGSSIAANRIRLIGAANLVIPIDGKATLIYCTGNRWELLETNFTSLSTNGFKARGVRTQTGFFDPGISGTTPIGIFQTPFSWIASYFSVGTVIEIDLAGTLNMGLGTFFFNLRIGTDNYSDIEIPGVGNDDQVFRLQYKITISLSNEIKIVANIFIGSIYTSFQTATKNMNGSFDIDIIARFTESSATHRVKSNLIEVKVY